MNINCVICSDLLTPAAEVYVTKCGHVFHYTCLINWLERKKTCPHCRNGVTEKTISRIYFNVAEGVTEDVGSLVNKVENLQFQLSLNQKDVKVYKNKIKVVSDKNAELRNEINVLESNIRIYDSTLVALKDQISYFKSKSKETDRLNSEIVKLKQTLKDLQNVQLALDGSKEQVYEIIRTEHNVESLAILAVTLKKSLLDVERSKRELEIKNTRIHNENSKLKRELSAVQSQYADLNKEIQNLKSNFENEKKYLKNKIVELGKELPPIEIIDKSLDRIVFESPVNFNRTPKIVLSDNGSVKRKAVAETDEVVLSTNKESPDLAVKVNPMSIEFGKSKTELGSGASKSGFRILKPHALRYETKLPVKSRSEFYDGLGGSSKEDIFPSPKPARVPLKRPKSSSSLPSNKMKKLAPLNTKGNVKNFFSQP